jgi:hypothetical protein
MIVSIMQPYYFPYLGYFQLIAACDVFVLYDDVQYSKGGWANRNRILVDGRVAWLTLPVNAAPLGSSYRQKTYLLSARQRAVHLACIESAYRKAPQFDRTFPEIAVIMAFEDERVAVFNANLIQHLVRFLGIARPLPLASTIPNEPPARGQERIIAICRRLGAERYLNAIGGTALYQETAFAASGMDLRFLKPVAKPYPQSAPGFTPFLSIIDVLMNNPLQDVQAMLGDGEIITPTEAMELRP